MTFLEQELQKIFKSDVGISDICFVGNKCYGKISETLCMKAYFKHNRISDRYEILQVEVLNYNNGTIDRIEFHFSELFGQRAVDSPVYPNGVYPYILIKGQDDMDWYVWHPKEDDYKVFSDVVCKYLSIFQTKKAENIFCSNAERNHWSR